MRARGVRRAFPKGPLLSTIEDVCGCTPPLEIVSPVRSARVVVANYDAILHDFGEVFGAEFFERSAASFCRSCAARRVLCAKALDQWIIDTAAFVSLEQIRQTSKRGMPGSVNSAIDHGAQERFAYRPPSYGRALVLPLEEASLRGAKLIDIKGSGVGPGRVPAHANADGHPAHGLEYLGVALGDFLYSWVIDRIFQSAAPGYWTVPVYAVLDLGFDIVDGMFGTAPAGLHVRRAHSRTEGGLLAPLSGSDEERVQLHMELLLRSFGLTSTNSFAFLDVDGEDEQLSVTSLGRRHDHLSLPERRRAEELVKMLGGRRLEFVNIQLTTDVSWHDRNAQLVDFGHIHAKKHFNRPMAVRARDGYFGVGRIILPDDEVACQPHPGLAVDPDIFDRAAVNNAAFAAADLFRKGEISARDVRAWLVGAVRRSGV